MKRMIAILVLAAMTCLAQSAVAGRPGTGTTPPQILPTNLGAPPNCAQSFGLSINNPADGVPLQVAGQGGWCLEGQPRPVLWTASTGMLDLGTIGGAGGGSSEGISDDGTVAGWLAGGVGLAFVRPLGGPMEELPKLEGMTYAAAGHISPNGRFIVGSSSTDSSGFAVRWDRSSGNWRPTAIPSGGAVAVSDDGAVVGAVPVPGNTTEGRARIWTENDSIELPGVDGRPNDTRANDISADGTVVVGFRLQPIVCRRPPCEKYEVPVVWTQTNGGWVAQELAALDGVDSEANAVAQVNGTTVIVGYGYTKKDAVMRAVFWKADAQGIFGAPTRLAGLDGLSGAFASAKDVNFRGQVVGYSGVRSNSPRTPSTIVAVMWQLP